RSPSLPVAGEVARQSAFGVRLEQHEPFHVLPGGTANAAGSEHRGPRDRLERGSGSESTGKLDGGPFQLDGRPTPCQQPTHPVSSMSGPGSPLIPKPRLSYSRRAGLLSANT